MNVQAQNIALVSQLKEQHQDLEAYREEALAAGNPELAAEYRLQMEERADMMNQLINPANQYNSALTDEAKDMLADVPEIHIITRLDDPAPSQKPAVTADPEATSSPTNGEEWSKLAETDPDKFIQAFSKLDSADKQLATMQMQQYTQEQNQMYSALTSLSQAGHDTAKAIISNFRV